MSRLLWFVLGGLTVIGTSIAAVALEDMSFAGNSETADMDDDNVDDDDDNQDTNNTDDTGDAGGAGDAKYE